MGWGRRKREITHKITGTIIAVVLEIRSGNRLMRCGGIHEAERGHGRLCSCCLLPVSGEKEVWREMLWAWGFSPS